MGRGVLLTCLLAVAACAPGVGQERDGAHGDVACADCHAGAVVDRELASVPSSSCSASDCHTDGGPVRVSAGSVEFEHRRHAGDTLIASSCAGCHAHADGTEPLGASTDACALCHREELDGDEPRDCQVCHAGSQHVGRTSQDVPVPHEGLSWLQGQCVRCHFDVAQPVVQVPALRCAACHEDVEAAATAGVGQDLHPAHVGVSCRSCHESGQHEIFAMSSAVNLVCGDCHGDGHGVRAGAVLSSELCNACHEGAHAETQRLLLGALPGDTVARPSEKFLMGLTCRSCHTGPPEAGRAPRDSEVTCTGCHRPEFRTVLRWWREGTGQRVDRVDRYVADAERVLSDDAALTEVARARELLSLVEEGGGYHNLPLTYGLLQRALEQTGAAFREAGRGVPPTPGLGRQPRSGLCSYCHYRLDDEWEFQEMDEAFHRDVLGVAR